MKDYSNGERGIAVIPTKMVSNKVSKIFKGMIEIKRFFKIWTMVRFSTENQEL